MLKKLTLEFKRQLTFRKKSASSDDDDSYDSDQQLVEKESNLLGFNSNIDDFLKKFGGSFKDDYEASLLSNNQGSGYNVL